MKRLALTLAAVMLLGLLGCGRALYGTELRESTAGTATVSESTTTESTEGNTAEMSSSGTMSVETEATSTEKPYVFTLAIEKENTYLWDDGSILLSEDEQAAMDIWHALEAEYGFTLELSSYSGYDALPEYCAAGQKLADLICSDVAIWGGAALGGGLKRLDTEAVKAAGLDVFNAELFEQNFINAVKIDGGVYCFDMCGPYRAAQAGYYMFFNKQLVAGAGYPAGVIYNAVRDGTWTWEMFADICRAGANARLAEDGYFHPGQWPGALGAAFLSKYTAFGSCGSAVTYKEGKYISTLDSFSRASTLNTVYSIFENSNMYAQRIRWRDDRWHFFVSKTALFTSVDASDSISYSSSRLSSTLQDSAWSFDYGTTPYPIGDKGRYVSLCAIANACFLQEANADWEKACFIIGKFAEAFCDTEVGVEKLCGYAGDAESAEIIRDYILPGIYVDPILYSSSVRKVFDAYVLDIEAGMDAEDALEKYGDMFEAAVANSFKMFNG